MHTTFLVTVITAVIAYLLYRVQNLIQIKRGKTKLAFQQTIAVYLIPAGLVAANGAIEFGIAIFAILLIWHMLASLLQKKFGGLGERMEPKEYADFFPAAIVIDGKEREAVARIEREKPCYFLTDIFLNAGTENEKQIHFSVLSDSADTFTPFSPSWIYVKGNRWEIRITSNKPIDFTPKQKIIYPD